MLWDYLALDKVDSYGIQYRINGEKQAALREKPLFEVLKLLGKNGWEYVGYDGEVYIFKRPMQATTGNLQQQSQAAAQPPQIKTLDSK